LLVIILPIRVVIAIYVLHGGGGRAFPPAAWDDPYTEIDRLRKSTGRAHRRYSRSGSIGGVAPERWVALSTPCAP